MGQAPRGMKVRIEGVKAPGDDPYRQGEPDLGRLVIEHRPMFDMVNVAPIWLGLAIFFVPFMTQGLPWVVLTGMFWLGMFLFAVAGTYSEAKKISNSTTITVDAERIVVRHGSTRKFTNREIRHDQLRELHCKKSEYVDSEGVTHRTFALVARLQGGGEVELIPEVGGSEPCRFAAAQIDAYRDALARPA